MFSWHNCYYENVNKLSMPDIPNNWTWVRLSSISNRIQYGLGYPSKKEGKNKYLRITDIQNNKVDWNFVPFVDINDDEQQYLLEDNDIVFARTGATVGKSYLVSNPPANATFASYLIRVELTNKTIAKYINYFFQATLYWNQIIDKSVGSGQPNCNGTKLSSLLIPIPPINELKKIVEKLDEMLPKVNNIILEKENLHNIIEKIKSKILEYYFGDNSCYKSYYENTYTLGNILTYEQPGPFIVKNTDYNDKYNIPVLTPGKTFILGYTNENEGVYNVENSKAIIFDDFTTVSRIVDFNFKVKSSAMKILSSSNANLFDIDYMFFLIQTINVISDTHKRYWISEYMPMKLKIHTIEQQKKIVNNINQIFTILDSMSNSI